MRLIRLEDAKRLLNLQTNDGETYLIDGFIICIKENGLQITRKDIEGPIVDRGETMFTEMPFRYMQDNVVYFFKNEKGSLAIYTKS